MKKMLATFVFIFATVGLSALVPVAVSAADAKDNLCSGAALSLKENISCNDTNGDGRVTKDERENNAESQLTKLVRTIINVFTVIVGIVAVVFVIIGGFKYITSGGDSGKVVSARNTIVYALVGLIIVALSQFIVRFVLSQL